jgi:hypothetical protein
VSVLAAGEQSVEMFSEDGEIAVRVVDAGVMMIGHCDGKCDLDIRAYGGQSKTVDECVIGVVVGAQEKAALGTAAGDHVVTTGHNLARECHTCGVGNAEKKLREKVPSDGIGAQNGVDCDSALPPPDF